MISILIPSKSEKRIGEMLTELDKMFPDAQIIIANDRYGKGKGWAMREAFFEATGEIIIFIDGDMDIHPRMIYRLLPFISDYDIVVGKKHENTLLSRRIITFFSRLYLYLLFGVGVDTQTGIKMFRSTAIKLWECDSYMFDLEILSKAKRAGKTIVEVPVKANILRKMKFISLWRCFVESLKLLNNR